MNSTRAVYTKHWTLPAASQPCALACFCPSHSLPRSSSPLRPFHPSASSLSSQAVYFCLSLFFQPLPSASYSPYRPPSFSPPPPPPLSRSLTLIFRISTSPPSSPHLRLNSIRPAINYLIHFPPLTTKIHSPCSLPFPLLLPLSLLLFLNLNVILSITTSGLSGHTFPETLLRHFVFSGHLPLLRFFAKFQKTASCFESHSVGFGRTSHLFGHYFDHDSPVQTPPLIEGGGLPTQAVGAYFAPQDDPGSPA